MGTYRLLFYAMRQEVVMFVYENPNPSGSYVGDCVIRAISIAADKPWDEVFIGLCLQGLLMDELIEALSALNPRLTMNFYEKLNSI